MLLNNATEVTNGAMTHELIAKVAKGIASASYDSFASDNNFYKMYPSLNHYVAKQWGYFIKEARATLAGMLGNPNVSESDKEEIYDALALDRGLPKGRISGLIKSLKHGGRLH